MNVETLKIFKGISPDIAEEIIHSAPRENFTQGSVIFTQWEDSNGKGYIVKSGEVAIHINDQYITTLQSGNMVGEIALLNEEERTATVIAKTESELIVLNLENMIQMISNDENKINKEIIRRIEENIGRMGE